MDVLIMKNNKLPLKERYNNFIQKHPKFWLTFIYCILMLALLIAMFVTALNPPDNKTANADHRPPVECPAGFEKLRIVDTNLSITASEVDKLLSGLPVGQYRYVSAPSILLLISDSTHDVISARSFRYICCVCYNTGPGILRQFYLSNSNADPIAGIMPTDAVIIASNRMTSETEFERCSTFIVSDYNFSSNRYVTVLFNDYSNYYYFQDLCGGPVSPDVLKAEYDKGFKAGYDKGKLDGSPVDLNPISVFLEPVSAFLNIKLFGFVSLGLVFNIVLFVSLALIFIKLFAGG